MAQRTLNGKTVWRETKTALKIFQTSTFLSRANQISTFRPVNLSPFPALESFEIRFEVNQSV